MNKGVYCAFEEGRKSTEANRVVEWQYCRKYGTLGKENE